MVHKKPTRYAGTSAPFPRNHCAVSMNALEYPCPNESPTSGGHLRTPPSSRPTMRVHVHREIPTSPPRICRSNPSSSARVPAPTALTTKRLPDMDGHVTSPTLSRLCSHCWNWLMTLAVYRAQPFSEQNTAPLLSSGQRASPSAFLVALQYVTGVQVRRRCFRFYLF